MHARSPPPATRTSPPRLSRLVRPTSVATRRAESISGCRFEPPACRIERDGVEGLRHEGVGTAVRAGDDPAPPLEPIDLEGALQRVDDPEVAHALARVDMHLPPAVDGASCGRDDLT